MSKKSEPVVACSLPPEELRHRRDELLPGLLKRAEHVMDLENGLRFHFAACPGLLSELASIIEQEQVCCSFLRFQISIDLAPARSRSRSPGRPELAKCFAACNKVDGYWLIIDGENRKQAVHQPSSLNHHPLDSSSHPFDSREVGTAGIARPAAA
jgi:hypothetical protein